MMAASSGVVPARYASAARVARPTQQSIPVVAGLHQGAPWRARRHRRCGASRVPGQRPRVPAPPPSASGGPRRLPSRGRSVDDRIARNGIGDGRQQALDLVALGELERRPGGRSRRRRRGSAAGHPASPWRRPTRDASRPHRRTAPRPRARPYVQTNSSSDSRLSATWALDSRWIAGRDGACPMGVRRAHAGSPSARTAHAVPRGCPDCAVLLLLRPR